MKNLSPSVVALRSDVEWVYCKFLTKENFADMTQSQVSARQAIISISLCISDTAFKEHERKSTNRNHKTRSV